MKSTWFKNRAQYDFASRIEDAGQSQGYRMHDVFTAFLHLAACTFRQAVHQMRHVQQCPVIEAEYMQEVKRWKNPTAFAEGLAMLVDALEKEPGDFLGDVYQSLGLADKDFAGQCFTPSHLCTMIAKMTLGEQMPGEKRLTLYEPCVGGGAMIIAMAQELRARGFHPLNYYVWARDISHTCWLMSYLQFTLLGIPATVYRGNSLGAQRDDPYAITFAGALFPYRMPPPPAPNNQCAFCRNAWHAEKPAVHCPRCFSMATPIL